VIEKQTAERPCLRALVKGHLREVVHFLTGPAAVGMC
jgi:hypothetical protein